MTSCRKWIRSLGLALAVAAVPMAASAQQVIKLTAIDAYPTRALWVKEFIEFYIPEVDKRLAKDGKYKIDWQQAWGGSIVKTRGVLEGIQKHLGDIGIVTTVFHEDKLPLNNLPYLTPFSSGNPKVVAKIMDDLFDKFPEARKQFEDLNQVVLTNFSSIDTYGLFTKTPVKSTADLKGMKIDAAGPNALYIKPFGAVPVTGSLVSYANEIKTGVSDGAIVWVEAAITFKINEVAPYYLNCDLGTGVNKSLTVNKDVWAKLPDEVKKVLKEVAVAYRDKVAEAALHIAGAKHKDFLAKGGKETKMSDADRAAWAKEMPNIAKDWADDVEKKGYPGHKFLATYMEALRAAGEKPMRDWDKN